MNSHRSKLTDKLHQEKLNKFGAGKCSSKSQVIAQEQ